MSEVGINHYINTVKGAGPAFTVNNAVNDVDITPNTLPQDFFDASGLFNFDFGENVFIETIRVQLPYSFGNGDNASASPAESGIYLEMGYRDTAANLGSLDQLGVNGILRIPSFNVDVPINTMINQPSNVVADWKIQLVDIEANISMLNVPASLNALIFTPRVFLKVRHTLNMV